MTIYETILATYPDLTIEDFMYQTGSILLRDDGDGNIYIEKWDNPKSLPKGLKVGK